ncbi:MAG: hypothetical protein ACRCWQ_00520 [Bacilli bacterium]
MKCMYCKKEIPTTGYKNRIGHFCDKSHWDTYYLGLTNEEWIELTHKGCICAHEEEVEVCKT